MKREVPPSGWESKGKDSCHEKRASRCNEKSPPSGRKRARERLVVLKREPLDAKRSPPVRAE
jgi:hypothetical protein